MVKRKFDCEILKEILEERSRTTKEFFDEAKKRGIKRGSYYAQRKNLSERNEIKKFFDFNQKMDIWVLTKSSEKASVDEIGLCIDEIKSKEKRLRDLGINEFVELCRTKIVTHDPRIRSFFIKAFKDNSLLEVHGKLLLALKYVIARSLKDGNREIQTNLIEENKKMLRRFIEAKCRYPTNQENEITKKVDIECIRLKKAALYVLSLVRDKEILRDLYNLIEKSEENEYNSMRAEILDIFGQYLSLYSDEIKREIYRIAIKKNEVKIEKDDGEIDRQIIMDRAIKLLEELSNAQVKILA